MERSEARETAPRYLTPTEGEFMGREARTAPGFPWRRSRNHLWLLACKWCALRDLNPRPTDP